MGELLSRSSPTNSATLFSGTFSNQKNAQKEKMPNKMPKTEKYISKGIDKHPKMEYNRGRKNKRKAVVLSDRVKGRYYGSYEEDKIERSRRT